MRSKEPRGLKTRRPERPLPRPKGRRAHVVLGALLLLASPSDQARGSGFDPITVGTTHGCDFGSLYDAVDEALRPGSDVIRVVTDVENISLEIYANPSFNGSLNLQGGFANCTEAENPDIQPSGQTTLTGNSSGPVIQIIDEPFLSFDSVVTLQNLRITGAQGHRGVVISDSSRVDIVATTIDGNGDGGLLIEEGSEVGVDRHSMISANSSAIGRGAGVLCQDSDSILSLAGWVQGNQTDNDGGGVAVEAGCSATLEDGLQIIDNYSNIGLGGGLAVRLGGSVVTRGAAGNGVLIARNWSERGGGVSVIGTDSSVAISNTRIVDNVALFSGGGVFVTSNASFLLERFDFELCIRAPRCAEISGNTFGIEGQPGFGAAIHASNGALAEVSQGYVDRNGQATEFTSGGDGATIYAEGVATRVLLEGLQFYGNTTRTLMYAGAGALIEAGFVSFSSNQGNPGEAGLPNGATALDGTINIYSAILRDHGPFVSDTTFLGSMEVICALVDTLDTTGASTSFLSWALVDVGLNPLFRDPHGGDLRLLDGSPAIDYCDTSAYTPNQWDVELHERGFDSPLVPNLLGPFDLGFDEDRDRAIFSGGFEVGDTSRWSEASP